MRRRVVIIAVLFCLALVPALAQKNKKGWIELFNGKDLSGWRLRKADGPNGWKVLPDGVYGNTKPSTDLVTGQEFYDFQLHVEFKLVPETNAGVYLRDRYEVQIFDSFGKPISESGCGALYRRTPPVENSCGPVGEWQSFDITFVGQRLTVEHNGKLIQNNIDVGPKGTGGSSQRDDAPGPLRLQGDHGSLSFRNVRIRPLSDSDAKKVLKELEKRH
ncbi:MAG: 3-keto-disaccharide hydrolase [Acidobacteriota bacterium]